jgi:CHAT domain-containing protein/Tfp pilus assembly protein PilF
MGGLLLAVLAACREPAPAVPDPLPITPLHRQLMADEVHTYRIPLDEGQYLQLSVDQHRVDLVVTLLDPRGNQLLVVDNPSGSDGSRGAEPVAWVAKTAGDHRLTIRARKGWTLPGCYRLRVEKLGTPDDDDRRRAAAEAAVAAGDVLYGRGRESYPAALDEYLEARLAFEDLQDRGRAADATYRIAKARQRLGERRQAIARFGEAAEAYRDFGNRRQQAISLFQRCQLYREEPALDLALAACEAAKDLWEEDRQGLAKTLNELGVLHRQLGDGPRAIADYDRALELWRELGDRWEEANVLHNRGRVYHVRGDRAQAVDDLRAALAIQRRLGKTAAVVTTLNGLGEVYERHGEIGEARRCYEEALDVADEDPRRRAITRTGLARVAAGLGEDRRALELFRQALEAFRAAGSADWEAVVLQGLGTLHAARGEPPEALDSLRQALAIRRRLRDLSGEAETLLAMARVARRRGDLETARRDIEEALSIVDGLRGRIAVAGPARAYYRAFKRDYFDFHVDLLMDFHHRDPGAGHDAEALTAFERARALSLLELLEESGADLERGVDPDLLDRRRVLRARIQSRELLLVRWAERPSEAPGIDAEQVRLEQRELLREYEKLEEVLRAASPRYAAATRPRTLTAGEIREQIVDGETVLLEYELGDERSFLWAVTPERIESFVLPGRQRIEGPARQAYELIAANQTQARSRTRQLLAELSSILLEPAADVLQGRRRLLVVAEGALQLLPFSALPVPAAASRAGWEVVGLPSASALAAVREQAAGRPQPAGLLAVVADPVYGDGRYPRLAYAGREAERILSLVPAESRLAAIGLDAGLDLVTGGALGGYRIVHFATHGELDADNPELSRLVLSLVDRTGKPRDGLLHAYQIYDLDLAAELVVLSACQTALGPRLQGEGPLGLTQGFLHAGAERLLVSLWQVDDKTTAELMERFYRRLLIDRLPPPAALRAAQEPLRHRPPYYWAGFVLQGEWRDLRR